MANDRSHRPEPVQRPEVHLNLNVRGLKQSATVAINDLSNAKSARGERVFKFGLGQSPFPVPSSVLQALKENAHQKAYLPAAGCFELREAVAEHTKRNFKVSRSPEDVLVGPGSKELMFLLQLSYYGDLLIPTPSWVSYQPQAKIIGRRVFMIQTSAEEGWRITPEEFHGICVDDPHRPRIVILNYPNNPSGFTYKSAYLKEIAEVAREHRVILLSDEIYGDLHHKGQHVSIARYYPEGTIISSGLSKWCGAGGWRIGTFLFPPQLAWLRQAMTSVASETFTSTCAPIQYAAVRAYQGGEDIDLYLRSSRIILGKLGRWCARRLLAANVQVDLPKGAFYLFPDFSTYRDKLAAKGIVTGADFAKRVLEETGVAFLPGSEFGRPEEELTARLAYVDFDGGPPLEEVMAGGGTDQLDDDFLPKYAPKVQEGIDRLCEWLEG